MHEPSDEARASLSGTLPTGPDSPLLYLSSTDVGWEGLTAQAFHEPRAFEGMHVSATAEVALVLFVGGTLHVERREANSTWQAADLHHGELSLNSGGPAYEVRWRSLSSVPTQTLHLHFSRDLVTRVAEDLKRADPANLISRRAGFRDPLLTQIALALWRELEHPLPDGKLYAQTAAQLLISHLLRQYTTSRPTLKRSPGLPSGLTQRQIKQVHEFVVSHFSEDISLDALASSIGFSSYHFLRLFRNATGVSPHQFVLRHRIERACQLLSETNLPLAQVAQACGFADQSHLTQVFKHQLGLTPRAYRQANASGAIF